jgi:hypothetical protein
MLSVVIGDNRRQCYNNFEEVSLQNETVQPKMCTIDHGDFVPNHAHVTNFDIFVLTVSIISHIVDVGIDINLAYRYFHSGRREYFILTVLFILFPALVNTIISIRM